MTNETKRTEREKEVVFSFLFFSRRLDPSSPLLFPTLFFPALCPPLSLSSPPQGLIDTSAVLDAIDSGVVGALALDVYENEAALFFEDLSEIPFEQRRHLVDRRFQLLMSYPNVLVTPHGE